MAVIEDEEVPSYPVSQARMQQFQANSMAAGAGGVPSGGPLSQGATQAQPAAAGPLSTSPYGLGGGYAQLYARAQQEAQERQKMQQAYLASLQQQEGALGQQGMSDYDKASLLFQAAGALGKPTRSGGFGETLGNLGEAMAGPLSKEAEKQRARTQQLQQLQLARQKLGMEMSGTGQPSVSDTLALMKAQQDSETGKGAETFKLETIDDKPMLVGTRGTIKPVDRAAAGLGEAPKVAPEDEIPPAVKALGPEGIKKYKERIGTKIADESIAAQQNAETAQMVSPILKRAEDAYNKLKQADAIGPIQGNKEGWSRWLAARVGTTAEQDRQDYEQAMADLELWRSAKLKGQGAITDFERKIIASSLPKLDAVNAAPGLNTFKSLNRELQAQIEKGSRAGGKPPAPPAADAAQPSALAKHPEADAALAWAKANPSDPRAAAILKRLGAQ